MAHANGRIYKDSSSGVGLLSDIREFFGIPENYIGQIITRLVALGLINKWSLVKPIHYPGKIPLETADFRGRPIDTNDNGLVYGLKVPAQVSVINPAVFHATSWDYLGYPNASGLSGNSLYRVFDFDGYDDNAVPDIYGLVPSESKFYIGTDDAGIVTANAVVNEGYRQNNQHGVTLARYVVDGITLTDNQLMARLAQCYPAILIGNYLTGVGVYNPTTGNVDYETIVKYNGGWVVHSDSWCVDMRKTDENGNRPWTSDTNTVATLVLVYTARSDARLIAADQDSLLTEHWFDMTEERLWTARIFPLPGACGIPILVEKYNAPGYTLTPVRVTATTTSVTVYMSVSYEGTGSAIGHGTVNARIGSGGTSGTRPVLRLTPLLSEVSVTFDDLDNDFGIQMLMPNTDYTIIIDTTAYPPTGGNTAHGEITFRVS